MNVLTGILTFVWIVSIFATFFGGIFSAMEESRRGCLVSLIALVIAITGFVFFIITSSSKNESQQLHATEHIVALQDNNNVEGHFYLGGGTIEQDLYYYYMVDVGNRYVYNKVPAKTAFIYFTNEDLRVEWWETRHDWWIFHYVDQTYTHRIYVPEGTIVNTFNVDLR